MCCTGVATGVFPEVNVHRRDPVNTSVMPINTFSTREAKAPPLSTVLTRPLVATGNDRSTPHTKNTAHHLSRETLAVPCDDTGTSTAQQCVSRPSRYTQRDCRCFRSTLTATTSIDTTPSQSPQKNGITSQCTGRRHVLPSIQSLSRRL